MWATFKMYELPISPFLTSTGCTSLMRALIDKNEQQFINIIAYHPETMNAQNSKGYTALHIACKNSSVWGLSSYVKLLLANGAHLNIRDNVGFTALMMAAKYSKTYSSEETVNILLDHGASVDLDNNFGLTALIHTANHVTNYASKGTLKILLERGANPNHKDRLGQTALMHVVRYVKNGEIAQFLIEHGADYNLIDINGNSVAKEIVEMKNKMLTTENKKLKDENDLLMLTPLPGKDFINLFRDEFKYVNKEEFVSTFIDAYIPILQDNLFKYNI
jgi:ankyrin repeat protein